MALYPKILMGEIKKPQNRVDLDHHIDIPFSVRTQKKILQEANFFDIEIIFQNKDNAIFKAKK